MTGPDTISRRTWVKTVGLSLVAGGVAARFMRRATPSWDDQLTASSARELLQHRHLPDVPLVTHQGRPVRFYEDLVKDKKIIINFLDRGTAGSETATRHLANVHRHLGERVGRDIHMYTVTLNPERDTPAILRTYARRHGDHTGWLYLTGDPGDVGTLRGAIGFAYPDDAEDADPSNITSILRYGSEPEMRWAHATTLGHPDMLVHMIVADFGPDPADPAARFNFFCKWPSAAI